VIAEAPAISRLESSPASKEAAEPLLLSRVVASLQVILATRRAARNEDHAYWYTIARGM
jgi:hypothetical protein